MNSALRPTFLSTRIVAYWISDIATVPADPRTPSTVLHDTVDVSAGFALTASEHDHNENLNGIPYQLRTFRASAHASSSVEESAFILVVALYVPDGASRTDCRRWLDEEHARRQLDVRGTDWYAGYESSAGPFNFLNLWGLQSSEVIDTESWATARDTPWRERLLADGIARTQRALFVRSAAAGTSP